VFAAIPTSIERAAEFLEPSLLNGHSGRSAGLDDLERAPTLTIERYSEDWSELADPANRTDHWTERFKFIPLNQEGSIYLTTGLEARSRYEDYQDVNWGSAPDDDAPKSDITSAKAWSERAGASGFGTERLSLERLIVLASSNSHWHKFPS
jgi:hypothetical protein